MQTTDSMNLKLFEDSDPVLPEDFNANTQAMETALLSRAKLVTGTYAGTYVLSNGNNNSAQVLTLPAKPMVIFIYGPNSSLVLVQGALTALGQDSLGSVGVCNVSWQGPSVSWMQASNTYDFGCDRYGSTYHYIALVQEQ